MLRQGGAAASPAARAVALFVLAVAGMTASVESGALPLDAIAVSPHRIAAGRLWLLVSSALVADRPVVLALVSFAGFAVATLLICGPRLLWITAAAGHIVSTLAVYLLIGLARLAQPGAFEQLLDHRDVGVSAIMAAWLGAVGSVLWRRFAGSPYRRCAIGAGCAVIGAVAAWVRSDITFLDLDHGIAFLLGIGIASLPVASHSIRSYPIAALASGSLRVRARRGPAHAPCSVPPTSVDARPQPAATENAS